MHSNSSLRTKTTDGVTATAIGMTNLVTLVYVASNDSHLMTTYRCSISVSDGSAKYAKVSRPTTCLSTAAKNVESVNKRTLLTANKHRVDCVDCVAHVNVVVNI